MKKWILILVTLFSCSTLAADWSTTSISYLKGSNFSEQFGSDNNQTELTFEHASGWSYGDNFFWFEGTNADFDSKQKAPSLYGEWSPRFSLGKIFDFYKRDRLIQDLLISNTLEFDTSRAVKQLYGLGVDLNITGFQFFQINFYVRNDPTRTGSTFQTTIAYKKQFDFHEKIRMTWGAYIDIVHGKEGTKSDSTLVESHFHTAQQILLDIGHLFGKSNSFYSGMEYQYWNRKYGTPVSSGGQVENNPKFMIKWVL